MDINEHLLTTNETAALLRLQPQTLRVWRSRGRGPRYLKIGNRVCYRHSDLTSWLEARTRNSTSDHGPALEGGR